MLRSVAKIFRFLSKSEQQGDVQNISNLVPSAMKFITAALLHRSDLRFEVFKRNTNQKISLGLPAESISICIMHWLVLVLQNAKDTNINVISFTTSTRTGTPLPFTFLQDFHWHHCHYYCNCHQSTPLPCTCSQGCHAPPKDGGTQPRHASAWSALAWTSPVPEWNADIYCALCAVNLWGEYSLNALKVLEVKIKNW